MNVQMNGRRNERTAKRTNEQKNERMNKYMNKISQFINAQSIAMESMKSLEISEKLDSRRIRLALAGSLRDG